MISLDSAAPFGAGEAKLHPLVLLNVADHISRARESDGVSFRAVGVLCGTSQEENRNILVNSFPLLFTDQGTVNFQALDRELDLYTQVYPKQKVLGWYSSEETCIPEIHQQFQSRFPKALVLFFPPEQTLREGIVELSTFDVFSNSFSKVPFRVEADTSERIVMDHIVGEGARSTDALERLETFKEAVGELSQRLEKMMEFVRTCKDENELSLSDLELLERMKKVCLGVPVMQSEEFAQRFRMSLEDDKLLFLLSSMSKGPGLAQRISNFGK